MKEHNEQNRVSLAGAAAGKSHSVSSATKKKRRRLVLLIVAVVLVLVFAVSFVLKQRASGPSLTAREMIQYRVTPDNRSDDVTYLALGIFGETEESCMDMVSLLCFNRKTKEASVLQVPVATYIGDADTFAVNTVGDVWAKPKAAFWCSTCRRSVTADEVNSGKHTCGTQVETKKGSSMTDFAAFFNKQYGLPVDNYLVIPREGLVTLIDAVGGVDMKVEQKLTVGEESYEPGVRTLSGAAAVYYVTQYGYDGTPASDRARMLRQRQLFAGLFTRLSTYKVHDLFNTEPSKEDVLSNVMLGANPVRMDTSSFGKARLMNCSESHAEDTKFSQALAEFIRDFTRLSTENITCHILPGVASKVGTATVYSTAVAQAQTLLQTMDPYTLAETASISTLTPNVSQVDTATGTLAASYVQAEAVQQGE